MSDNKPDLKVITGEHDAGDVFDDLEALRKEPVLTIKRKEINTGFKVEKPTFDTYFRSHPTISLDQPILRSSDRDFYFVTPAMRGHPKLVRSLRPVTLALVYLWPSGELRVWPVPILGERPMKSQRSERAAYESSLSHWTQIAWNAGRSDFDVETADNMAVPVWPEQSFGEILKTAFSGRIIDNEGHPYVQRLLMQIG
jgi:hypothetical protein